MIDRDASNEPDDAARRGSGPSDAARATSGGTNAASPGEGAAADDGVGAAVTAVTPGAPAAPAPTADRSVRALPRLLGRALSLVWNSGRRVSARLAVLAIAQSLLTVAQLAIAGRLIGEVQRQADTSTGFTDLLPEVVVFTLLFVLQGIATIWVNETRRLLGELTARHAQRQIIDVAAGAPLLDYERPAFHDLLERALANGSSRPLQVATSISTIATSTVLAIALVIALVVIEPLVLIVLVVGTAPVWLLTRRLSRLTYRFSVEQTPLDRRRNYLMYLLTSRINASELRSFRLAGHMSERHDGLWRERIDALTTLTRNRGLLGSGGRVLNGLVVGGVVALLVWTVTTGRADLAAATTAAGAVAILGQRLTALLNGVGVLYECALFLSDVEDFSTLYATEDPDSDVAALEPQGRLVADGITFRYPAATKSALSGASVHVASGEVIALVGANGSGKTTLAKVLAGLLPADSGALTWNGSPISASDPAWHEHVAVVFQDYVQYMLPLLDNIALGRIENAHDLDAVHDALASVDLDTLPAGLSDGLATTLAPEFVDGTDLSGGQWQRIAIARAFFRDSPVVIMDEPSAALDPDAESRLFDAISTLAAGRAVIVISHRLATVTEADRIYVMSDGGVLASGTHRELMASSVDYARMFNIQASRFQSD